MLTPVLVAENSLGMMEPIQQFGNDGPVSPSHALIKPLKSHYTRLWVASSYTLQVTLFHALKLLIVAPS